jgi:chromate transporter
VSEVLSVLWAFTRVGVLGFGGGPSMIPLIRTEAVDLHPWLTAEQFLDAFAFGSALPGPIATKLAAYAGYQAAGWGGATAALVGISVPTIVAMIALAAWYARHRETPIVRRFVYGVRPVVLALLALVAWDFAPAALAPSGLGVASLPLAAIASVALLATLRTNVHPALLIVAGGAIGLLL